MGRILEHSAKQLLEQSGIPVPKGVIARSVSEVEDAASALGGQVVLKALVPVGRRAMAGGVVMARCDSEAVEAARRLLGAQVGGYPFMAETSLPPEPGSPCTIPRGCGPLRPGFASPPRRGGIG